MLCSISNLRFRQEMDWNYSNRLPTSEGIIFHVDHFQIEMQQLEKAGQAFTPLTGGKIRA